MAAHRQNHCGNRPRRTRLFLARLVRRVARIPSLIMAGLCCCYVMYQRHERTESPGRSTPSTIIAVAGCGILAGAGECFSDSRNIAETKQGKPRTVRAQTAAQKCWMYSASEGRNPYKVCIRVVCLYYRVAETRTRVSLPPWKYKKGASQHH